jgi:type I pantothenate kinase
VGAVAERPRPLGRAAAGRLGPARTLGPAPARRGGPRRLRGINEHLSLTEAAEIHHPLSRLLSLYVGATKALHVATDTFLGDLPAKVPYVIGIAGSVAVGKSTTAACCRRCSPAGPTTPASSS